MQLKINLEKVPYLFETLYKWEGKDGNHEYWEKWNVRYRKDVIILRYKYEAYILFLI